MFCNALSSLNCAFPRVDLKITYTPKLVEMLVEKPYLLIFLVNVGGVDMHLRTANISPTLSPLLILE